MPLKIDNAVQTQEIVRFSVATKIENGPKTDMKNLWFLKMDQRIFVNSKIL